MRQHLPPSPGLVSLKSRSAFCGLVVSESEFEARVASAREEFAGLLDEEALRLLVLDELGLNSGAFVLLADLAGRPEASVRVTLERVDPPREFQREGRPSGRVANCVVRDASGEARLTLWDRDVEKVEDGTLRAGVAVTIINARVKDSKWGAELHVSPWTVIEVEGALDPAKKKLLADVEGVDPVGALPEDGVERVFKPPAMRSGGPLRGTLSYVSPTRTFRRADGGVGFVCDIDVDTGEGPIRVVCWDESVKVARGLVVDGPVEIEPLLARPKGALLEWHTTKDTKFKVPSERD